MTAHSPTITRAIAYYRVSTARQGQSGLGLEGQRAAVAAYAKSAGLAIAAEYVEVETGTKKRARPILAAALAAAAAAGAVLLIAKLDRLARNVAFVSSLMEAGVRFVAVDMPSVTPLTLHVLAAVAEQEAAAISARTKAALDVKRARDGEWRISQLSQEARQRGADARRSRAMEAMAQAAYTAGLLRAAGLSLRAVAERLNANGYTTAKGAGHSAMSVKRMIDRVAQSADAG